jgi:sulfofructose kinase
LSPLFDVLGIGLNATDTLILVPEFPPFAGKVPFERELLSPGGQVATAVVTCARLGLRTKYIGTIGDDLRGDIQRESLEGTGVDTSSLIVRQGCPNQTAYILIDGPSGERTVIWQRADCLRLKPEEIEPSDIANARILHIDGFDIDAAAFAASTANQSGVPVSIDIDSIYPGFDAVLKHVDYLVAGSGWPAKYTGEADPFVALSRLQAEYHLSISAMTLGDRGALALKDGQWFYSAAFEVTCADTTGAGDAFHGAFCYAMVEGLGLAAALDFSNAAAALNCTGIGARGHIPVHSEVESLLSLAARGKLQRRVELEVAREAYARSTRTSGAVV